MNLYKQFTLRNGMNVTLRPIRQADAYELLSLHQRSSSESLYYRYLRSYTPSYEELQDFCTIENDGGVALVAVANMPWETVIGFGYYLPEKGKPTVAEPAFHIEDRFHGLGLGTILYKELCKTAVANGITYFNAYVHPGNEAMTAVFAKGNHPVISRLVYGTREIEIALAAAQVQNVKRPLPLAA